MLWLLLLASQTAPALDLIDLLDAVDLGTRDQIEAALDERHDLVDLSVTTADLASAPRTRDRAISLSLRLAQDVFEQRRVTTIWAWLTIDLDALLLAPSAPGLPPDERRRLERCARLFSEVLQPPEREARFRALACGGGA